MAARVKIDCRKYPSDKGCTVAISGAPEAVVELAGSTQKCTTPTKTRKKRRSKIGLGPMRKQPTINDSPIELCPDAQANN